MLRVLPENPPSHPDCEFVVLEINLRQQQVIKNKNFYL